MCIIFNSLKSYKPLLQQYIFLLIKCIIFKGTGFFFFFGFLVSRSQTTKQILKKRLYFMVSILHVRLTVKVGILTEKTEYQAYLKHSLKMTPKWLNSLNKGHVLFDPTSNKLLLISE